MQLGTTRHSRAARPMTTLVTLSTDLLHGAAGPIWMTLMIVLDSQSQTHPVSLQQEMQLTRPAVASTLAAVMNITSPITACMAIQMDLWLLLQVL